MIVQFGGQTPLKLAHGLEAAGIAILGTSPDAIDLAEDRERFQKLIRKLGLKQPDNGIVKTNEQAEDRGREDRLSGGDPAILCARRTGHGDRPRRYFTAPLHEASGDRIRL